MENKSNFSFKVSAMIAFWIISLVPTIIIMITGERYAYRINFLQLNQNVQLASYIQQVGIYTIVYNLFSVLALLTSEWIYKKRIHPIQYLLILLSLTLFNLLLLSFAEHFYFSVSFILAAIMTIILITFYTTGFFNNKSFPIKTGIYLTTLFLFMFVMITLPESALLVGSLSFFVLLAIIMYYTRKIDFYVYENKNDSNSLSIQSVFKDKNDSL